MTSGFFTLGVVWLVTLGLAVRAIAVLHDIEAHRFWIITSVSLTFVAVVIRIESGVLLARALNRRRGIRKTTDSGMIRSMVTVAPSSDDPYPHSSR